MGATLAIIRAAFKEAVARPAGLALEITVMIANDVVWVLFWLVFSHNTGVVRGWDAERLVLLFAVVACVVGLTNGLFANARHLSRMVTGGELDAVLTLPVRPLSYLLCRRISAFALGDLIFGVVTFAVVAGHSLNNWIALVVAATLGAVVFTSFLVIISAVSLWFNSGPRGSQLGFDIATTFAMYPLDYFGGATKFLLMTVVPVAFIAAVPAAVIYDFALPQFAMLLGAAAAIALVAQASFSAALARYRSGSQWSRA